MKFTPKIPLLLVWCFALGLLMSQAQTNSNKRELLTSTLWQLNQLKLENKVYDSDIVSSRAGTSNLLEFAANGTCYIRTPAGKVMQRNSWAFNTDETQLVIHSSEENAKQVYAILSLNKKQLMLELDDRDGNQIFVYVPYKAPKKKK
ncbi:glycosyltransferase [Eisenibacter elegans]|jgi:hypothetical protein|uniref:glycosyltransferase n=1 Tax=Eisenibacter elegans TaxID=997 RepID=UPI00047E1E2C|nr:glycosyltransferase [Eisenibacter elegans]